MRIEVEAERDTNGALVPQRLLFDCGLVVIKELRDRWHGDGYQYFKVIGDDGNLYILHLDEHSAAWSLTMFALGARLAPPPPPLPRGKQRTLQ